MIETDQCGGTVQETGNAQQFAIWLMPDSSAGRLLCGVINELARRGVTPAFEPHVTLCTGRWNGALDDLKASVDWYAENLLPIDVDSMGIGYADNYFQYLYMSVSGEELQRAGQHFLEQLGVVKLPQVKPHISLAYNRDFISTDRTRLKAALEPLLPQVVRLVSLALVMPAGNDWCRVSNWQLVYCSTVFAS